MKSQTVRLIDVFALGPLMIYIGLKEKDMLHIALLVSGILTIAYNADNYLKERANV